MIIVGELINASRKAITTAIEDQDTQQIRDIARQEADNGADYIDVNAGVFVGQETDYLKWLVTNVQEAVDTPCCIDSPDPAAIEAALSLHQGTAMLNSISLEKDRYESLMPIVAGTDLKIIALCMSDQGMPETTDARLAIADKLVNGLVRNNVPLKNIYVDPLVQPISTNQEFGVAFLTAIEQIMARFEGIHTICGLSNISYGLPQRALLNQTFMAMAIGKGLDGAIVDPLNRRMMATIYAAEALAGYDEYCEQYLTAYRQGKLS